MTQKTPTSVRIGPFTYSIAPLSPMDSTKHGLMGWNHYASLEIRYRDDVEPQKQAHTIVHEVLHGIWSTADLARDEEDEATEEFYVTNLATALCDLIRNNPDFIAWVSQTLSGPNETGLETRKYNTKFEAAIQEKVRVCQDQIQKQIYEGQTQPLKPGMVYVNDKPTLWA